MYIDLVGLTEFAPNRITFPVKRDCGAFTIQSGTLQRNIWISHDNAKNM